MRKCETFKNIKPDSGWPWRTTLRFRCRLNISNRWVFILLALIRFLCIYIFLCVVYTWSLSKSLPAQTLSAYRHWMAENKSENSMRLTLKFTTKPKIHFNKIRIKNTAWNLPIFFFNKSLPNLHRFWTWQMEKFVKHLLASAFIYSVEKLHTCTELRIHHFYSLSFWDNVHHKNTDENIKPKNTMSKYKNVIVAMLCPFMEILVWFSYDGSSFIHWGIAEVWLTAPKKKLRHTTQMNDKYTHLHAKTHAMFK